MTGSIRIARAAGLGLLAASLGGCAAYSAMGDAANFRAMGITPDQQHSLTESDIREHIDRKPAASFPARIAVVRLQGSTRYGRDRREHPGVRVVPIRDIETDEQMDRLTSMDGVAGVAPLSGLTLPDRVGGLDDLRSAAAAVQADMLLAYTFDTRADANEQVPPLSFFTLGFSPTVEATAESTASAALIDTRTGYIYGIAEGSERETQVANNWTWDPAVRQTRRRAEKQAFEALVGSIESMWSGVYAAAAGAASTPPETP